MYYVYRFLNKANQIVYVGKTGHLEKRMTEHFSRQGHLTEGQYKQVKKIEYTELKFQLDMDILEKYLINLWKPSFNSVDKDSNITLFSFNNVSLKWKDFDKKKIIKPKKPIVISLQKKPKNQNHYLDEEIRVSNELINILIQSNLTLNEHKLLNAMFAQINPEDSEFKLLKLYSDEIKKLCYFSSNYRKREIIKTASNLLNINIFIKKDKQLKNFPLIKTLKYQNNILFFQFDENLKSYLLNLKENFIQKKLKEIQIYKNECALKLSLLFSVEFDKKISKMSEQEKLDYSLRLNFLLDELKQLSLTENKYPLYANFKQRVLKEALDEINEREQYKVEFNESKEKSKVTGITFFVKLNKNNERYIKIKEKEEVVKIQEFIELNQDIANELKKRFDYNDSDFKNLYKFSRNQVIAVLKDLKEELSYKKMTNEEIKEFVKMELYQFVNKPKKDSSNSFWDSL